MCLPVLCTEIQTPGTPRFTVVFRDPHHFKGCQVMQSEVTYYIGKDSDRQALVTYTAGPWYDQVSKANKVLAICVYQP